ncbi:MAG: hypothetical protein HFG86_11050 [Dorea sp.]|jgi:predicted transcriptional regulator YheO|nr:hypothetical protein [Dorea sp.]
MRSNSLQQYITVVEFLGKTLGPDYEVVLQDLNPEHQAIVAIANGHISGRQVGSPLTDASLQMLSSKAYESNDFLCNYKGVAINGHVLRSSTMFIKDDEGKPIGFLCINFDDSRFQELNGKLLTTVHPGSFLTRRPVEHDAVQEPPANMPASMDAITENFSMDISSLMQKIFDDATASLTTPIDRLNQHERKDIIEQLQEQGLFQLKGAISFVAKKFSCSTATIYRYLSEVSD